MDAELLKLLGSGGAFGALMFIIIKYGSKAMANVVSKLYEDMTESHKSQLEEAKKREEKLMKYLDEKNASDLTIASSMVQISAEMTGMKNDMCEIRKGMKS